MAPGFKVEYFLIIGAIVFVGAKHLIVSIKNGSTDEEQELMKRATTLSDLFTGTQQNRLSAESHETLYTSYQLWCTKMIDNKRFDGVLKGIEQEVAEILLPRVKVPRQLTKQEQELKAELTGLGERLTIEEPKTKKGK
jgi:hypothetical protein